MGATFYDEAAPGMSRLAGAFANTARLRQVGALYGAKNMAEISKLAAEAQKIAYENQQRAEIPGNQALYGATSAGVSVPEFNDYQRFRQQGGPIPQQAIGATAVDDEGNPNLAPRWNANEQTKLANALRSVALMRSATAPYSPENIAQSEALTQRTGATGEALAAAHAPDEPGGAAPQGGELVRRIAASFGHNVLAEKDDRVVFEKELDSAGVTDPAKRQALWQQYLQKKSTHPSAVNINMPNATHFGTDPKTGQSGMYQIGRDGKAIFTPMGPGPSNNPIQALIAGMLKDQPGAPAAPGSPAAAPAAPAHVQRQFDADPAYKGKTLGKEVPGKGWEVKEKGTVVGYVRVKKG